MKNNTDYECYEEAHKYFDKTRLAIGSEQLIDFITQRLSGTKTRILDAGCGTGLLLQSLAQEGFRSLTGIDLSQQGLNMAAKKLKELGLTRATPNANIRLIRGDIRCMPFEKRSFELIVFSFVLHHLPHSSRSGLEAVTLKALVEARELIEPGGWIVIITCSPEQLSAENGCMWYYKYFPEAANRLATRFLDPKSLSLILKASGFRTPLIEDVKRTYWTESSLDPKGPISTDWQSGDSLFALCREQPALFTKQLSILQNDIITGEAQKQIALVKERTELVKQATFVIAQKPKYPTKLALLAE